MVHHVSNGGFIDDELSISRVYLFVMYLWKNKGTLVALTWPLLLPVLGFVGFVLHTGSIVLGKLPCFSLFSVYTAVLAKMYIDY